MKAFFSAVRFLTRIPAPPVDDLAAWRKSPAYYPLVGLLVGAVLYAAVSLLTLVFSPLVSAVLTLALWVFITGGLHLDGWIDMADAIGSSRSREQMLAILKDSRTGAMGVVAAVVLLLAKAALLHDLIAQRMLASLLLPALTARSFLVAAILYWPYLSENGLGSGLREGITHRHAAFAALLSLSAAYTVSGWSGVGAWGFSLLCAYGLARYLSGKLGGLNGDGYGALVEWTELVMLLAMLALAHTHLLGIYK